ncbi:hypothetical protein [Methanoculleus frigidifontis]|nr:hypothetical protein [Methanoculleus sp. FWC-SCC1]
MQYRTLLLTLLLVAGCIPAVMAAPALPCEFYGDISVNGNPAPAGTVITATIGGEERGRLVTSAEGVYGGTGSFDARLLVQAAEGEDPAAITFLVDGVTFSQTALYAPGEITRMDLAVQIEEPNATVTTPATTVATTAAPTTTASSSGSSGSSPAGSTPTTAQTPSPTASPEPTGTSGGSGTPDLTASATVQAAGTTLPRFTAAAAPTPAAATQQAPLQYAPFAAFVVLLVLIRKR